jgi:hypothetical protein
VNEEWRADISSHKAGKYPIKIAVNDQRIREGSLVFYPLSKEATKPPTLWAILKQLYREQKHSLLFMSWFFIAVALVLGGLCWLILACYRLIQGVLIRNQ